MLYQIAADLVLALHLGFVLAVVFGGLLWLWLRWAPLVHLPIAGWGAFVELAAAPCPLTALENQLLTAAGSAGYDGSFIGHYLLAALYPEGLTHDVQLALGLLVVVTNACIYAFVWQRRRAR